MFANPAFYICIKTAACINNLSLSRNKEMTAGLIQLVSVVVWSVIQNKTCVCLLALVYASVRLWKVRMLTPSWVCFSPAIQVTTLCLAHWYFCSVTLKRKFYNQGLGIHRNGQSQTFWNFMMLQRWCTKWEERSSKVPCLQLCSVCWF